MTWSLAFEPLLPMWLLVAAAVVAVILVVPGLLRRMRGAWLRAALRPESGPLVARWFHAALALVFAIAVNLFGAITFDRASMFYDDDGTQERLFQPD